MSGPDRRNALAAQHDVTGIDFVYVHTDQVTLDVFFLTDPLALAVSLASLPAADVHVVSDEAPETAILGMAWAISDARNVLRLTAAAPGDFVPYRLHIDDARIDPFFNDVAFSFKANCPSDVDCAPSPHQCPPEPEVDFPVDTLARDFWSLRTALLDYASQRYPDWKDRLEADAGVMLAETLSALGDEMSYYQDRVAREATLETATQRRSLRRHARLVDHVVHDGLGAFAWLDVQVAPGGPHLLAAGTAVWALSETGRRIPFEVGQGFVESLASPAKTYELTDAANLLLPHIWDEAATCLPVGATELHVRGHRAADLPLIDAPPDGPAGRWLVLATDPADPSLTRRRWLVRLLSATDEVDPLVADPITGSAVTRLRWEDPQATRFEMDLESLTVHGNIVPATAGRTMPPARFCIGKTTVGDVPPAVERTGPNGSNAYLFSVPDGDGDGLVWLPTEPTRNPRRARPEIRVREVAWTGSAFVPRDPWSWRRALLGTNSSRPGDRDFTLDDGTWTRTVGYQRLGGEFVHRDYLTGAGVTVRFGDGEFGRVPSEDTCFEVNYRLGNGARLNLAPESIVWIDAAAAPFVQSVTNPFHAGGGLEPESADEIRSLAPDAYRELTLRAVRPADYAEAAERLPWVQRAGCAFRWTGSWLTAFVAADPRGAQSLAPERRQQLTRHLDRFRQTGREVHVVEPRYADIDLQVKICLQPVAFRGDVLAAMRKLLFGPRGFFGPDNFTFGVPLDRSELEAAIHRVPGVRAVEQVRIRRRGWFDWRKLVELQFRPAPFEVIRLENDPRHPTRGTLTIVTEGGA